MHPIRYAHSEGYTEVCFTGNKNEFITTGEDGEIRIWQDFDDTENRSIQVGEKCFALAYGGGKIYVSNDQNEVKKYDLESSEEQCVITSFTLPVTCMALNKANTHLVCGSADFEVHLVDLESLKRTKFSGHEAPILSLCFDPLQKYFISSSCDSTARIWSVANLNMVKQLTGLHAKSNDFMNSESWCKIAWHKDGGIMAVPCKKDVDFYERESWILKFKINLKY
jgi:chromosome transmission fidelity protein 4